MLVLAACGLGEDLASYTSGQGGPQADAQPPDASVEGSAGASGEGGAGGAAGTDASAGQAGTAGEGGTQDGGAGAAGEAGTQDGGAGAAGDASVDQTDDGSWADADAAVPDALSVCTGGNVAAMVTLPAGQRMDATEVTNCQYKRWLDSSPTFSFSSIPACSGKGASFTPGPPWPPSAGTEDYPVTNVDVCDAHAYCQTMGKRLCGAPTGGTAPYGSAELVLPLNSLWSYACTSNGVNAYPYGNYHNDGACNDVSAGTNTLAPVATFPACQAPTGFFHGIFDLSGNAWEWEDACQGGYCRVRGGDFWSQNMNCAAHAGQAVLKREATTGFRCCRLAGDLPM